MSNISISSGGVLELTTGLSPNVTFDYWTPEDICPMAWYDASDEDTITLGAGGVSQWEDKGSFGIPLTQSTTSSRPQYAISGQNINDLNTVTFESGDSMEGATNPFGANGEEIEDALVIMVMKINQISNPDGTFFNLSRGGSSDRWKSRLNFSNLTFAVSDSESIVEKVSDLAKPWSVGENRMISFYSSSVESLKQVYIDGFRELNLSVDKTATINGGFQVGGTSQTYGEFIVINGCITEDIRLKVEGYLAHKWGIVLLESHPYHLRPPLRNEETIWKPLSLNPYMWFDASNRNTIEYTSKKVSSWHDLSGEDNDVTQSTEDKKPLTDLAFLSGQNVICFCNASNKILVRSNGNAGILNDVFVCMVAIIKNPSGTNQNLFAIDTRRDASGVSSNILSFDVNGDSVSGAYTSTDPVILGFYCSATESVKQIYKDGSLFAGNTTASGIIASFGQFNLGGIETNSQDCDIAEFIYLRSTISTDDRQKVEGYLAWKWGLQDNLPIDHPYKTEEPFV